ncbi:MAG: hypothetical protein ACPGR5_04035 [Chitinophagales bacterium]
MENFKECYPKNKFEKLSGAISILDERVKNNYPSSNTNNSYIKWSKAFINNPKEISIDILSDVEIKKIKILFNSGITNDFFTENKKGFFINKKEDYYFCLSKIKSENKSNYINNIDATGINIPVLIILQNISMIKESNFSELDIFCLKIEYLKKVLNYKPVNIRL